MVCFMPPANWKLRWTGRFFGKYNPAKIIQEETDNLNSYVSNKDIEFVVKHLPAKKTAGLDGFTSEFFKTLKEK